MFHWRDLTKKIADLNKDENFLKLVHCLENIVAKILSIALLGIIIVAIVDLIIFLSRQLFVEEPIGFFSTTLIEIFGLFLNILIALELLENITAYLRKQIFQVELVLVTSLIAVARKIIIFDLDKKSGSDLLALAIAILSLSIGYTLVRLIKR